MTTGAVVAAADVDVNADVTAVVDGAVDDAVAVVDATDDNDCIDVDPVEGWEGVDDPRTFPAAVPRASSCSVVSRFTPAAAAAAVAAAVVEVEVAVAL